MKKKVIIGVVLAVVVVAMVGFTLYRNSQPAFASVKVNRVQKGTIAQQVYASGQLELSKSENINAPFAAKVEEVDVKLGDQVKAGQTLLVMDTAQLQDQIASAKLNLQSAQASLAQADQANTWALQDAKNALDTAQNNLNTVKSGGKVMGQLGLMTEQQAQDAYNSAKTSYDRLAAGGGQNGKSSLTSLQIAVKQSQLALSQLQDQLDSATVKAPIDGTVVSLNAVAGSEGGGSAQGSAASLMSAAGGSLLTIGDLNTLQANLKVNEVDSSQVAAGQKVTITGDAFTKEYTGKVVSVAPQAQTSAGTRGNETTVEVIVSIDNSSGLKPGYNINATIVTQEKKDALLVAPEAVTDRQGHQVVFVQNNGVAEMHTVTEGLSTDSQIEILSGLKEGEQVILNPSASLKQGDQVKDHG